MSASPTADDVRFIAALDESQGAVAEIAAWYSRAGYTVTIPGLHKRPNYEARIDYADNADLYLHQPLAVKHLSAVFTSREDWPFRDFIVCAKHAWDHAKEKPTRFLLASKDMRFLAVVFSHTHSQWTVQARKDSRYDDMTQLFYFCPLDLVVFQKGPRWREPCA